MLLEEYYLKLCGTCIPKHDKLAEMLGDCYYCVQHDFVFSVRATSAEGSSPPQMQEN